MAPALRIPVSASLTQFEQDMGRARQLTDQSADYMETRFNQANPSAKGFLDKFRAEGQSEGARTGTLIGVAIGTGIAAALAGVSTLLFKTIDALAKIGDRSQDLRLPVNLLQALSVAAGEARVPAEQLNSALDQFTKVSKQGSEESKNFLKALDNIGPGFSKAFQSAPTQAERLRIVADALKSTDDEVKRAQLSLQAFGTDNERLIGIFDKGREGISAYIERVRALGLEINEQFVAQAQQAKSQLSTFSRVLSDEFSSSVAGLIPLFIQLLPYIERLGAVVRDTMSAFITSDQQKPLESLSTELSTLQKELERTQELRDRMAANKPTELDSLRDQLRAIIGPIVGVDLSENISDLDKKIEEVRARMAQVQTLVDARKKLLAGAAGAGGTEAPAFKPRPSLAEPAGESKDAFDREIDRINRHITTMRADATAVGQTAAAHEALRTEMVLLQALEREGNTVTTAQIDKYAQLRATMSSQQALQAAGINLTQEQAEKFTQLAARASEVAGTLNRTKDAFAGINDALRFSGNELVNVFDRATQKGANWGSIMQDVIRAVIRQLLLAAIIGEGAFAKMLGLNSAVPGGVGGLGGLFSGLGGLFKSTPAFDNAGVGTGFATGGFIPPGRWGWTGEQGPERIFGGRTGATVVPNDVSMGRGGQMVMQSSININVERAATSSDPLAAATTAKAIRREVEGVVMDVMMRQLSPGGRLNRW